MSDRPFARIYYVDLARDYPDIWLDDAALAAYVRLLSLADTTWPVVPEIPRSTKRPIVERLIAASLVCLLPPFGYKIKGFDAERSARSNAAGNAARTRWSNAAGNAGRNANTRPDQTRPTLMPPASLIDPQTQTAEEYAAGVIAAQEKRTGVKL